jgi:hypothetical protein
VRRIAVLIITALLLGSACGDDEAAPEAPALDAADRQVAAQLADSLGDLSEVDFIVYLTGYSADMECWAGRLVGALGAEGVTGITAAESESEFTAALAALSSDDRKSAAVGLAACVDRDALLDEIVEYLDQDVAECAIEQMLGTDDFAAIFDAWVTGDDEAAGEIEAAVGQRCGM